MSPSRSALELFWHVCDLLRFCYFVPCLSFTSYPLFLPFLTFTTFLCLLSRPDLAGLHKEEYTSRALTGDLGLHTSELRQVLMPALISTHTRTPFFARHPKPARELQLDSSSESDPRTA